MSEGLALVDIRDVLQKLQDVDVILVGGQAINAWAHQYHHRATELTSLLLTSKDIDYAAPSRDVVQRCAQLLHGQAAFPPQFSPTPSVGKVAFVNQSGSEWEIDFIASPIGVERADLEAKAVTIDLDPPIDVVVRLMHPVHCLISRITNLGALRRMKDEHAVTQTRAACIIAREYLADAAAAGAQAAAAGDSEAARRLTRTVLDWNRVLYEFALRDMHARDAYCDVGIDPAEAICAAPSLPSDFLTRSLPDYRKRLAKKRGSGPSHRS